MERISHGYINEITCPRCGHEFGGNRETEAPKWRAIRVFGNSDKTEVVEL